VVTGLPALTQADKLQRKASSVGFDWPDSSGVFAKVSEELDEVREEMHGVIDHDALLDECGDLLFAVVNLVRHAGIDPESALRQGNRKFVRRFQRVEASCARSGIAMSTAGIDTLSRYWEQAKRAEHGD
ncbi:MAG: nucleoside triphosphate pyrophosphohydrolase, partial [Gammaproteobacteria bacterium]|nr:nucleoside triphosphate pyrophosphohydrolase [Gammaproteobacteria bacterium]